MIGRIYLIINKITGKKYVGCTRGKIKDRWNHHWSSSRTGSRLELHKAMRRYGKNNFSIELIETVVGSIDDLWSAEIKQIAAHASVYPNGYNLTRGGEYGNDSSVAVTRRRYLKAVRKRMLDPAVKRRHLANMKTEAWKLAQKEGVRLRELDPKYQQSRVDARSKYMNAPGYKEKRLAVARKVADDPAWKSGVAARNKLLPSDPKWRRAYDAAIVKRSGPAWIESMRRGAQKRLTDPEWQKKSSASLVRARAANAEKIRQRDALRSPEDLARVMKQREYVRRAVEKRRKTGGK